MTTITREPLSLLPAPDDDAYGFDTTGGIRSLLYGYSGGISIVRELAQNADDAPGAGERWMELYFDDDALRVRNSSFFREEDFRRIKRIAAGGKVFEEYRTTGTFGVGFVSVYQITDTPVLRSSGYEMRFLLESGRAPRQPCDTGTWTEFELPYQREPSVIRGALGMDPVANDWDHQMLEVLLPQELPGLLLFTEHLSRITVFHRGQRVMQARRKIVDDPQYTHLKRIAIVFERHGYETVAHSWLRFDGTVSADPPARPDGRPAKDRAVHVAVPELGTSEALWQDAGRLYNYQPTNIATQLPFHINGDFVPSTDRKSIDNGHETHRTWNMSVIEAIGECFATALPVLREHFAEEPQELYRRLPLRIAALLRQNRAEPHVAEIARPIVDQAFAAARELPIFRTISGWRPAESTRWVAKELRPAADGVDEHMMSSAIQNAAWELVNKLGVREYTLEDLLRRIAEDVVPERMLADGPPYLRSPAQLETLYSIFEHDSARRLDRLIAQTPVFLDHKGRLQRAVDCVQSPDPDVCQSLGESGLRFWLGDALRFRYTAARVPEFSLAALWRTLAEQISRDMPLSAAPPWINTRKKIYQLYDTILRTRKEIAKAEVAQLRLCLDRNDMLRPPSSVYLPGGEPVLYEILEHDADAALAAKPIHDNQRFHELYRSLGVRTFGWMMVLERFEAIAQKDCTITNAHDCLNTREKLIRIYGYLSRHRNTFEPKHVHTLRYRLPIWLCRDEKLHCARDLALPPDTPDWPQSITIDRVIPVERRENLHPLFEETLELHPLDTARFIEHYLLPQYGALNGKQQLEALNYLRVHAALLRDNPTLLAAARATPLIQGDDQRLHRADELCFVRSSLIDLFPDRFRVPRKELYAGSDGEVHARWYDFFQILGVNHHAPIPVILDEIDSLIRKPPRQTAERIEKIFRYLGECWDKVYMGTSLGAKLRERRWLPADGDQDRWHKPIELYPRQDKPLVDQVESVLGLSTAQRPQKGISDALGFPTTNIAVAVRQLRRLSELGKPPADYLYEFLNRMGARAEDLKPLRGLAVIYDRENGRYWKASQVFLSNQKRHFGDYRCYVVGSKFHHLFHELDAREGPVVKDYLELLFEISAAYRGKPIPDAEASLLINAYTILDGAPDELLAPLRDIPCVLSEAGAEGRMLRLPEAVLLQPAERYLQLLPQLPIARYEAAGATMLGRIGVRDIEADGVLIIEYPYNPDHSRELLIVGRFVALQKALRRILHHHNMTARESAVIDHIKQLRAYEQSALQVRYLVKLGPEAYCSDYVSQDWHYDQKAWCIYLRSGLSAADMQWALADVLHQILGIAELLPQLLVALFAEPGDAQRILDRNRIRPLPPDLDLAPLDDHINDFIPGVAVDPISDEAEVGAQAPETNADQPAQQLWLDIPQITPAIPNRLPSQASPPARTRETQLRDDPSSEAQNSGDERELGASRREQGARRRDPGDASEQPKREIPADERERPLLGSAHEGDKRTAQQRQDKRVPATHPRFMGRTTMTSPQIPTDWDALCSRVRDWLETQDTNTSVEQRLTPPRLSAPRIQPKEESLRLDVARFVLSYGEYEQGFLRIVGKARDLFPDRPIEIMCITDFNHAFPLWFDWERDTPIAHNQTELAAFFADHGIPAGGIVYLERVRHDRYRLYYEDHPHTVRAVRIALSEGGEVRYETIEEVQVPCETVEAIYRAEKRHEDQAALWLEAVGKKSVAETLCDLLMAAPHGWVHEDDLAAMVEAERMVAAATVPKTLRGQPYFVTDGMGNWRLDGAALLAAQHVDIAQPWLRATKQLLSADDTQFSAITETIRPPLDALRSRVLHLERASHGRLDDASWQEALEALAINPHDLLATAVLEQAVLRRCTVADVDLTVDTELRGMLAATSGEIWPVALRPTLRRTLDVLRRESAYQRAAELAQSWADFDPIEHGLDLTQLSNEARAWRMIQGAADVRTILEAITLAPSLTVAYKKLHAATQRTLQQIAIEDVVLREGGAAAAIALYGHVSELLPARQQLASPEQGAFDRTVKQHVDYIWDRVDESARLHLALQLPRYAPSTVLTDKQFSNLVAIAQRHQSDPLNMLVLNAAIWQLCPRDHYAAASLATTLARAHMQLQVWELVNNQPWQRYIDPRLAQEVRQHCQRNTATHLRREQRLLAMLSQHDDSPLGVLLTEQRRAIRQLVEHDIERLAESAA